LVAGGPFPPMSTTETVSLLKPA